MSLIPRSLFEALVPCMTVELVLLLVSIVITYPSIFIVVKHDKQVPMATLRLCHCFVQEVSIPALRRLLLANAFESLIVMVCHLYNVPLSKYYLVDLLVL